MDAHFRTHEIENQPTPLVDYDLFATDRALAEAAAREGAEAASASLSTLGRTLGSADVIAAGIQAERHPPTLRTFDRFGRRRDEVEFHPAWHRLLALGVAEGLHTGPWAEPEPGAHVARAAAFYMLGQVEAGVQCPLAMTYGAAPVVARAPALANEWLPRLYSRRYDPRFAPAAGKSGALMGMGMTEKQGGSDVRANTTRAEPVAGEPGTYRLIGHKWFFSAPMCDAFLVLAQAPGGLSCFFLPRWTPDGALNALRLQRLKDKLGDRANASSEVEFEGAWAWLVGAEGRGVATILETATYTRLDCVVASAGLMRQALAQATHHARQRTAFQRRLVDQPLMANVLADLALETEAATVLALRLARAFDRGDHPREAALRRLLTPAAKYWVCKRTPPMIAEALEVLGGNGYVEEGPMARLYRQAPLNSLWEGTGNLMALDALRALGRSAESAEALAAELAPAKGGDRRLDRHIVDTLEALGRPIEEADARRLCERMTLAVQAALLVRFAPAAVADGFCASRLAGGSGRAFGALPPGLDLAAIVERATPA
ncbi:isovaleryl-CoA dehydrogenase [Phenylobacterium sp. LjRoot219]|uniref:isovaleryl-CoA dehydrogenase n=1 Tax=Phenylobacterium sp. LjRoot219 TaxID=3342283 RepID=UPI003ECF57E9